MGILRGCGGLGAKPSIIEVGETANVNEGGLCIDVELQSVDSTFFADEVGPDGAVVLVGEVELGGVGEGDGENEVGGGCGDGSGGCGG